MLSSRSAVSFYLPCCWASRKPITNVEFKFVAKQVKASVVIRAAKLKFVAESRARVYFAQHVASTCNIVVLLQDKLVTNVVIRITMPGSTCNTTMSRDKLKENVALITGPSSGKFMNIAMKWYVLNDDKTSTFFHSDNTENRVALLNTALYYFMESTRCVRVRYLRTSCCPISKRMSERGERISFLIQKQWVRKYRTKHFPSCNLLILYLLRFSPSTRCSPFRGKTNVKLCFYSACGTLLLLEKPSANIFCLKCLPRRQSAVFSCVGFVSLALLICKSFALSSKCEINNDTTDSFLDRI